MRNANPLRYLLLVLLLVPAGAEWASGSVYRCVGDDGGITFSDRPCTSGASELPEEFERNLRPVVEGKFSREGRDLEVVDGAAYWTDVGMTLRFVLVPRMLVPEETERLRRGDFGWLRDSDIPGHVRIELLLDRAEDLGSLRHMRTIVVGLNEKPDVPWTSNHNREEIPKKVSLLDLQPFEGVQMILLNSAEISEYIRWDLTLRLPLLDES